MTNRPCICGCGERIASDRVSCTRSWYRLPAELRRRIWRAYRAEQGGDAHLEALREAYIILHPA